MNEVGLFGGQVGELNSGDLRYLCRLVDADRQRLGETEHKAGRQLAGVGGGVRRELWHTLATFHLDRNQRLDLQFVRLGTLFDAHGGRVSDFALLDRCRKRWFKWLNCSGDRSTLTLHRQWQLTFAGQIDQIVGRHEEGQLQRVTSFAWLEHSHQLVYQNVDIGDLVPRFR